MIDAAALPQKGPEFDLQAMLEAGIHFGHQSSRWHPKMKPWIHGEKDGVHIFDLTKTADQLTIAYNYAYSLGQQGKTLVVVGTKKQSREVVAEYASKANVLYINSRWLGGLLTNWTQVRRSLKRMVDIKRGLETDAFKHYTKYERTLLEKELGRLQRFFSGIEKLQDKPDCLFIIDPKREKIAVKEAATMEVPMIGLVDSNADPTMLDVVIPGNDDARKSIEFIVNAVINGYKAGQAARK